MEGKAPTGLYITLAIVLAKLGLVLVVRKDILAYLTVRTPQWCRKKQRKNRWTNWCREPTQ